MILEKKKSRQPEVRLLHRPFPQTAKLANDRKKMIQLTVFKNDVCMGPGSLQTSAPLMIKDIKEIKYETLNLGDIGLE